MSLPFRFNSPYLNHYMQMVEDTESPRLYHVWSALSAMSAALGRRCFMPFGPGVTLPNQFVLLIGAPGTRKSTAASIARRMIVDSTGVRIGPNDTAGQRQGLIKAIQGENIKKEAEKILKEQERQEADPEAGSLMGFSLADVAGWGQTPEEESEAMKPQLADKHHLHLSANEFTGLIGEGNLGILQFMTQMWDGDDYTYETNAGTTVLKNPLVNLVGCTTQTSLATALPPTTAGQGLLSRFILVYGAKKYKSVPRPAAPPESEVYAVKEILNHAFVEFSGAFEESPGAMAYSDSIYDLPQEPSDSRFLHYHERRQTHLRKVAMCLAAGRKSMIVEKDDYMEAHRLLRATELGMPDALGEFGLSKLAAVKQRILEYLRATATATMNDIYSAFHRDGTAKELMEAVSDLTRADQIIMRKSANGDLTLHAKFRKADPEDQMMRVLAEG